MVERILIQAEPITLETVDDVYIYVNREIENSNKSDYLFLLQ